MTRQQAERALETVRQWVEQAGLTLHPVKTRLVDASERGGFDFLGYHFERGLRWPRKKSLDKFKETIRQKTRGNTVRGRLRAIQRQRHKGKGRARPRSSEMAQCLFRRTWVNLPELETTLCRFLLLKTKNTKVIKPMKTNPCSKLT